MSESCPACGSASPAFRAVSDAVLAVTSELRVEHILQKLVHAARDLARARYAALGIPDDAGGFAQFLTSGMSDALVASIGPLPRTHGLLDAMLRDHRPYRSGDIQMDSRFQGWPPNHPTMTSFLGVPILARSQVIGAFYLTDKKGAAEFDEDDQRLIEVLAAHAAVAIDNARLFERSRELSVVEERNRLALELHDSVTQTLFSVNLTAQAAVTLIDRDPPQVREQIEKLQTLTAGALEEMRALVFELRGAEVGADGLIPTLSKHVDVLRRIYQTEISLEVIGERRYSPALESAVLRILQEALNNCMKHSGAAHVKVSLEMAKRRLVLSVSDDGVGFDPSALGLRSKHLGLTSMEERAAALGASLRIDSKLECGTAVSLEVPVAG